MITLSIFYKHKEGGFNKRLYRLYNALAENGYNIHYIAAEKLPVENSQVLEHVIKTPFFKKENYIFWSYFIFISIFYSFYLVKKHKIKKIITFAPFYTFLCILPSLFLRIPAITFIRIDTVKDSPKFVRNLFFYVMDWIGIKLSSIVIVNSSSLKNIYQQRYSIDNKKIKILPNNIVFEYRISYFEKSDVKDKFGLNNSDFVISTAGVFNPRKNFSLLIRAMSKLKKYPIKLLIIGDEVVPTGEKKRLHDLVEHFKVEDLVLFCGWQQDPLSYVACSDLFVFPTQAEGSPNSLLEALGCGVPCIGSRIDEISEILFYDDLLFSIQTEDELVSKIRKIIIDANYYQTIKDLSLKRVKKFLFNWDSKIIELIK